MCGGFGCSVLSIEKMFNKDSLNNNIALTQVLLFEPMMALFTDAYMAYPASI